ncbi:hypothetical protein J6590_060266 [Homalodisca vitripennis]|nr:hypothetical protein J6590_060266 [Homalodisca vitripennis]
MSVALGCDTELACGHSTYRSSIRLILSPLEILLKKSPRQSSGIPKYGSETIQSQLSRGSDHQISPVRSSFAPETSEEPVWLRLPEIVLTLDVVDSYVHRGNKPCACAQPVSRPTNPQTNLAPLTFTQVVCTEMETMVAISCVPECLPSGPGKPRNDYLRMRPSLTLNLVTISLDVTSNSAPMTGQAGCCKDRITQRYPPKQQPRSTLLDLFILR